MGFHRPFYLKHMPPPRTQHVYSAVTGALIVITGGSVVGFLGFCAYVALRIIAPH